MKLPALTRTDIEALPDGWWLCLNQAFLKVGSKFYIGGNRDEIPNSAQALGASGGITARLVEEPVSAGLVCGHKAYWSEMIDHDNDLLRVMCGECQQKLVDPAPLLRLLEAADCPACDGSGRLPPEGSKCQWCDEREAALEGE